MASDRDREREYSNRSRRDAALFQDVDRWIDSLEDDAHWARNPDVRREKLERARILRDLRELALG